MSTASTQHDEDFMKLVFWRWPDGAITCPHCSGRNVRILSTRKRMKCRSCRKQFSATSGTILHSLKLPADKALRMIRMLGITASAKDMERNLGVQYRTAYARTTQCRSNPFSRPKEGRMV